MEFPHWDLRVLVELTGEKAETVDHHEFIVSNSKGHSIFLGPSSLALKSHLTSRHEESDLRSWIRSGWCHRKVHRLEGKVAAPDKKSKTLELTELRNL
ncbi:hypothetical protein L0244_19380 [bacterium]|nr:hypothetical protein [bacterium]